MSSLLPNYVTSNKYWSWEPTDRHVPSEDLPMAHEHLDKRFSHRADPRRHEMLRPGSLTARSVRRVGAAVCAGGVRARPHAQASAAPQRPVWCPPRQDGDFTD